MKAGVIQTQEAKEGESHKSTCMTKPGFGKYDLDTGLSINKKVLVRSQAGNKGLKKDAYQ